MARLEGFCPLGSILRLMEGVAGQEGYCSEDLLPRVVGWKGPTKAEKTVGWNVKPSPSYMARPLHELKEGGEWCGSNGNVGVVGVPGYRTEMKRFQTLR